MTSSIVESSEVHTGQLRWYRLNNPSVQNFLMACVLFCNPGLYLAILGLGAGGGQASSLLMAQVSNACLYAVFAVTGILGGTILTKIGPRWTVLLAISGYPLYTGSLWYFDKSGGQLWFPLVSGCWLGFSGGCLWTTASFIANVYASESEKGAFRAIQWTGNSVGATVGAGIALAINFNAQTPSTPQSVYIIFIVLQCASASFALLMIDPNKLIRPDGTPVAVFRPTTLKESIVALGSMFKDWRLILMLPAFFTPEAFIVLQSSLNAYAFNLRTRSLNNVLSYACQIPVALFVGYVLLDNKRLGSRRRRGLLTIGFDAIWITGTYIALTLWLHSWGFDRSIPGPNIDITDAAWPGAVAIYVLYGSQYGIFQNTVLWVLGSMSNEPKLMAHLGGVMVCCTAVSFGIDSASVPYEAENGLWFALSTLTWPILAFVTWKYIRPTNYFVEEGVGIPVEMQNGQLDSQKKIEAEKGLNVVNVETGAV
ncbi:unnamed protein product [Clonostachys rhizophaga]|uniref:MFS general substrate transporter n=1 Tax=Clonostachys rhizophaga TaxID=160324 RepID=A0A9N9YGR8_9HYPO|nr:unnamed protein product [Clonostachys rhizophaga]